MTGASTQEGAHRALSLALLEWLDHRDEGTETIDETLEVLSDQRSRLLLDVLTNHEQELTLPDAAEEVAQREANRSITDLSAERIANVYISLYHDHLPKLLEVGLLEYDQERDLVAVCRPTT